MSRPSRIRKSVNYSDFQDDDDFASVKPLPKKPRMTDPEPEISCKTTKVEVAIDILSPENRKRGSLDSKQYERDLEAALTLSLMDNSSTSQTQNEAVAAKANGDENDSQAPQCLPPVLTHCSVEVSQSEAADPPRPDSPPVLSNCSVDGRSLELNQISMDTSSSKVSKPTKASEKPKKATKDSKEDDDDDYQPQNTPDSESDGDFSGEEESEDETVSVKKKQLMKQKTGRKTPPAPKEKKEKKPAKATKAKSSAPSPAVCQSPVAATLKKKPCTPPPPPPLSKHSLCSGQAGGRPPKWTPPGQLGRSPGSSHNTPARSPGQGLRLGLSRMARVKPLHPNVAAN